ncbi:MAG: COG4315 family predicted lipoprotein [Dehalococcoidia bacterium]
MRWTNPGLIRVILIIVSTAVIIGAVACASAPVTVPPSQQQAPATPPIAPPATPPAAAPATTPSSQVYTVGIANKAGIGDYLVDSKGMTVYYFLRDTNEKSNATAAIVKVWPVFYAANVIPQPPLLAGDFRIITRDDGTMQSTYLGWPLYYYAQDQVAGDTKGQQFNNLWFVITSTGFMSAPAVPLPAPQPKTPQQYTN